MKIQASLRNIYANRRPVIEALKKQVDLALSAGKPERWHYESRIKELESFAVKIESGRFDRPAELEDLLACTIVVPNSQSIPKALSWISTKFDQRYRRPASDFETSKRAESFPFDDLRIYCVRGNDGSRPEEPIDTIIFEIQIKTFLQHAWGVATHDLSYKTDDVRWGKDRIVAHLKAAIEYAELTILEAESLSHCSALQLSNKEIGDLAAVIGLLKTKWAREDLPTNLRGLASTILDILKASNVSLSELEIALANEILTKGSLPQNLSPYGVILQLLINNFRAKIERMLKNERTKRIRLLVTPELNLPFEFTSSDFSNRLVKVSIV